MVTIGGSGASCGPHFDHYDVFLFQLRGEKHWQWDTRRHEDEELDLDSDLRLLPSFDPEFSQTMGARGRTIPATWRRSLGHCRAGFHDTFYRYSQSNNG